MAFSSKCETTVFEIQTWDIRPPRPQFTTHPTMTLLMISLQVYRLRNTCGKNQMKGKVKYE